MHRPAVRLACLVMVALPPVASAAADAAPATGPLRVHPDNGRYFTDGTKSPAGGLRVVYLAGSHTWDNLQSSRTGDGPARPFDYPAYLKLMRSHGHNFMRLWAWEGGVNQQRYEPLPYAKTGSGKYDLNQFDGAYFERLRSRVSAARDEGVYVSVMLFQGWSIYSHGYGNPWPLHPFNKANNVNGIDGDPNGDGEGKEVHSLEVPAITGLQEAYVRKVVDTVNALDNVLYEVTNETAIYSRDWQYHVIRYVKEYEKSKPKQHPVGITAFDSGREGSMKALLASPADWISPQDDGESGDYQNDPPAADGRKVSIADTDHIYGTGGDARWVWKTFTRGHNPVYMDPLKWDKSLSVSEADIEGARRAMGQTRRFAERINLAAMEPAGELASTKYCLADPGRSYLVFAPEGGALTVDLSAAKGELAAEWFDPKADKATPAARVAGGGRREVAAPFDGAAVLYLQADVPKQPPAAAGPLRIHPTNPRYFTDGAKSADGSPRAVYLTGAHTWNNLVDMGRGEPPEAFDFEAYLGALGRDGHNFIRLWAWDSSEWDTRANGSLGKQDFVHHVAPLPWQRSGPGEALDGKPKFDLSKFDPAYFERLRNRVAAAGRRGIYVSVMLFEGWGLMHGNQGRAAPAGWAWRSHPFNPDNNVNGLKFDEPGRVHRLGNKAVNDLQAAYIRKVVETVNDLDNVLYEVINEGGEKQWDRWVIRTVRDAERGKPKRHPIGLTGHGAERLADMLDSDADWVSPGRADGYAEDPPAWDAKHGKVSVIDTDHVWGVGGDEGWVWKSFIRGHNPIFMDPYDGSVLGTPGVGLQWARIRRALGQARRLADRVNLAAMRPADDLASTKYCLADAGTEYLVYAPDGGAVTVDLSAAKGEVAARWFDPARDATVAHGTARGGAAREFKPPFSGAAVLHLKTTRAE